MQEPLTSTLEKCRCSFKIPHRRQFIQLTCEYMKKHRQTELMQQNPGNLDPNISVAILSAPLKVQLLVFDPATS